MSEDRITCRHIKEWPKGKPLGALTAYDYPVARLLDESGVEILHVGDTLGMVVLGLPDTTGVKMEDVLHHLRPVVRARKRALITADLTYRSYETPEEAVRNARLLVDEGADAVKMEGGSEILPQIRAVLEAGIEVQGHLGMLPQHVLEDGGKYRKKGKVEEEAERLLRDIKIFEEIGVFSVVLEGVVSSVAKEMTNAVSIPTIGIGSGVDTTGQILVTNDLVGMYPWFVPPFVKQEADFAGQLQAAVAKWKKGLA